MLECGDGAWAVCIQGLPAPELMAIPLICVPWLCPQDDAPAMNFVTAAANLRMHIFSINMKSKFDVKCKVCTLKISCQRILCLESPCCYAFDVDR